MKQKTGRKLLSFLLTLAMVVGLMPGMGLTAYASTEKSETITTTAKIVNGTYFTISNNNVIATTGGMAAYKGITVSPKNTEYITKVVITCGHNPENVSDNNTSVSSGSKAIEGSTITVTNVNANTFTFTCNNNTALFNQFVVYYLDSATPASSYSVTITAGDHMTKTTDSGAASQTGLSGAMTDVVYTANDGYYFPTDYSVAAVNGISVTRDSYTQITVSGTPSANAEITLVAPTAKTTPDAPTTAAAVDCTTTDNNDGKLTGVTTAMEYKKSDATDWIAGTGSDITGLVPGTYYVRLKATDTTTASDNQELTIAEYTTPSYEVTYKVVNGTWSDDTTTDKTETVQSGSTPASVPTGMKAASGYTGGAWDTNPAEATITGATTFTYTFTALPSYQVTYKVINGTWSDDTTTDKTETVQSGSKPASVPTGMKASQGFTGGAWDENPADATITGAKTFTYTFTAIPTYTVTYKVVNGTWSDDSTTDKTETVQSGSKPASVPTGMKASQGFTGGAWDENPADATITGAKTFTYTFTALPTYTVTYKVVNGTWSDDSTTDKTETVQSGSTPASVPTGMKAASGYTGGAWDTDPTDATITGATTFTYTFQEKTQVSYTVTFKVENGKWNDDSTADKTVTLTGYEGDTLKLTADQIPAVGTKPNDTYKAGSWDVTPNTTAAITEATTYTYTYAQKDSISQTVTFKVVNGSWDDETTADKTVTLTGYEGDTLKLAADQIPAIGSKPNDTYKAGSWDVTPSADTAITEATTYTYTYAAKEASVVTKAPEAKTLTYNGQAQELVTAGTATGGEMQYALGTATEATQPYTTSIPTATDAGTYYVWYKAIGDENHNDTEAACVEVTIKSRPVYQPSAPSSALTVTSEIGTITRVTVDGKAVDSKYYTASGNSVVLSDEFMRGLSNGTHTIRLYDGETYATATWTVTGNDTPAITAPKTADPGLALYGLLAVSSTLGLAWVARKRKAN